jgi:carbon-monoxide dehydrogenase small subunit
VTEISLVVNGRTVRGAVEPRTHLADFLRDQLQLTATHLRCEQGVCGACTILIDGEPARSCIAYAVGCEGAEVTTLEGLEHDPVVEQLRAAFTAEHGLQCGFCTPGMLVTARDIVTRLPDADAARVRVELSGNLCRCTGYAGIVRAICRVLDDRRGNAAILEAPARPGRLGPVGARHLAGGAPGGLSAARPEPPGPEAIEADETDLGLGARAANLETTLSFAVARPVDEVWAALADIERVARCMPGASLTDPPRDGRVKGRVVVKIGPISTSFSSTGRIVRDDARREGVLYGAGRDRFSGSSARAEVGYAVRAGAEDDTRVEVTMRALLAGPLAQFGRSGIVQDVVSRLAGEFARRLERSLAGQEERQASADSLNPAALVLAALKARLRAALDRLLRRTRP